MMIEQAMDDLVQAIGKRNDHGKQFLRPGLSRGQIELLLAPLQLSVPEPYYRLYQWHNGVEEVQNENLLFGEYEFIPLNEAISEYDAIQTYYTYPTAEIDFHLCLPFASFMGATLAF